MFSGSAFASPDGSWRGTTFGATVLGLPGLSYEETYYNPINFLFSGSDGESDDDINKKVDEALNELFSDIDN